MWIKHKDNGHFMMEFNYFLVIMVEYFKRQHYKLFQPSLPIPPLPSKLVKYLLYFSKDYPIIHFSLIHTILVEVSWITVIIQVSKKCSNILIWFT